MPQSITFVVKANLGSAIFNRDLTKPIVSNDTWFVARGFCKYLICCTLRSRLRQQFSTFRQLVWHLDCWNGRVSAMKKAAHRAAENAQKISGRTGV